jgi:hypothetical protein
MTWGRNIVTLHIILGRFEEYKLCCWGKFREAKSGFKDCVIKIHIGKRIYIFLQQYHVCVDLSSTNLDLLHTSKVFFCIKNIISLGTKTCLIRLKLHLLFIAVFQEFSQHTTLHCLHWNLARSKPGENNV